MKPKQVVEIRLRGPWRKNDRTLYIHVCTDLAISGGSITAKNRGEIRMASCKQHSEQSLSSGVYEHRIGVL